jgi:dTDP-4-dehydrorhamnose 3,5-epimerase
MASCAKTSESALSVPEVDWADIPGVAIQDALSSSDQRGAFVKFFQSELGGKFFSPNNLDSLAITTNSLKGTVRGLHFQLPPFDEEKIIFCISGEIFDVFVDIRANSPTAGCWASLKLNTESPRSLILPRGIAHGYQTLIDNSSVFYGLSNRYSQKHSRVIDYKDSDLSINWPINAFKVSQKDSLETISLAAALQYSL